MPKYLTKAHKEAIGRGLKKHYRKHDYHVSAKGWKIRKKATSKMSHRRLKRLWRNPEYRNKMLKSQRLNGKRIMARNWRSPKWRKLAAIGRQKVGKATGAKNGRKHFNKLWKDPKFIMKMHETRVHNPSKTSLTLLRRLCRLGIDGLRLEYPIKRYSVDIAHLPSKTVIECDGKYWHKGKERHDRKRDGVLKKLGWHVIRIELNHRQEAKELNLSGLLRKLAA